MTLKYEPLCGDTISNACGEAVRLAVHAHTEVEFNFNDTKLIATPNTDPEELCKQYTQECNRRREEYFNSQESKDIVAKYEREEAERRAVAKMRFAAAQDTFELKDSESWQKAVDVNKDEYGADVIDFASKWARLMEVEIKDGEEDKANKVVEL